MEEKQEEKLLVKRRNKKRSCCHRVSWILSEFFLKTDFLFVVVVVLVI